MIGVEGLRFGFGGAPLFDGLDLSAAPGEVVAVLGASGCGKSTLLRLVAGLLPLGGGRVTLPDGGGGVAVSLVFQDPRLLPWMTVEDNLRFALRAQQVPVDEWPARIHENLSRVGLPEAGPLRPAALSGGMAQRVALARALALHPRALLLDEPFAAVDPLLREELQGALQAMLAGTGATVLLVTHDVGEALVLGDRVVVLGGRPAAVRLDVQVDAPRPRGVEFRLSAGFVRLAGAVRGALGG